MAAAIVSGDVLNYMIIITLTHLPPGQNGRHFADDIFQMHFR